jgi:hypothetical protein
MYLHNLLDNVIHYFDDVSTRILIHDILYDIRLNLLCPLYLIVTIHVKLFYYD